MNRISILVGTMAQPWVVDCREIDKVFASGSRVVQDVEVFDVVCRFKGGAEVSILSCVFDQSAINYVEDIRKFFGECRVQALWGDRGYRSAVLDLRLDKNGDNGVYARWDGELLWDEGGAA